MISRKWVLLVGLMILGGLGQTSAPLAQELEFSPQDQVLALGDDGRLAVVLNEAVELRTIELEIQYDPTIIAGFAGGAGAAFDELSCYVWEEFTDDGDGTWEGFAVSFGTDCFVVGPGELFVWDFSTLAEGMSPITVTAVRLFDPAGNVIPDVELGSTTVIVGEDLSGVGNMPAPARPEVRVVPNPFNPRTHIEFEMREAGRVRLRLFDLKGRLVCCLIDGVYPVGPVSIPWDGLTDQGLAAPSGVYLFRLETNRERSTGRMTLAR